jgi:hypothetical protein
LDDVDTADDATIGRMLTETLGWAGGALYVDIFDARAPIIQLMERGVRSGERILEGGGEDAVAAARKRWRAVIALGRSAEPAMSLGARHGSWERVLLCVEHAARADLELSRILAEERSTEADDDTQFDVDEVAWASEPLAWALHQRGSRALLDDELDEARVLLNASLAHRRNKEGRDLTRSNLILLPLGILPFALLLFIPLFVVGWGATQVNRFDERAGTADITPDAITFAVSDSETEEVEPGFFEVENVGTSAVWVRDIEIVEERGTDNFFEIPDSGTDDSSETSESSKDNLCETNLPLAAGDSCTIMIGSNGGEAVARLRVSVQSRAGKTRGDQWALLVSEP